MSDFHHGLLGVLLLRAAILLVAYHYHLDDIQRFHVESAVLAFVVVGSLCSLLAKPNPSLASEEFFSRSIWLAFAGGAALLYAKSLTIGFLSDDFVLLERAKNWQLGQVAPELLRPLPLAVWAVFETLTLPSWTFHALNIALHGTNSFLAAVVAHGWVPRRTWSLLAGIAMLVSPLATEPVVWCAGVFDLLSTTLALTLVLLSRGYSSRSWLRTSGFLLVGLLAIASKESAAVAGVLVLVDAYLRGSMSRALIIDIGILLLLAGAVSIARLVSEFGLSTPPVSKYILQRALFQTIAGFASPWHSGVSNDWQWLPLIQWSYVLAVLYVLFSSRQMTRRASIAALAWMLVSIAPVYPGVSASHDLQGSRYFYLGQVGWSIFLIAVPAHMSPSIVRSALVSCLALHLTLCALVVRHQIGMWREASILRDSILNALADPRWSHCPQISVSGIPDNTDGAYVFRNGLSEAASRYASKTVRQDAPCLLKWEPASMSFKRVSY